MSDKHTVSMTINGHLYDGVCESRVTLADFIRHECGLTGTHLGCEHGVCGACTILIDGTSARSCLMFAVQADGCNITTVEGLATASGQLSPLQEAFRDNHGLQCGFCTSGILIAATELLGENPDPSEAEVRERLSGNLCRCTGYQFIIDSVIDGAGRLRG